MLLPSCESKCSIHELTGSNRENVLESFFACTPFTSSILEWDLNYLQYFLMCAAHGLHALIFSSAWELFHG